MEPYFFTDFTTSFHWLLSWTKLIQSTTSESILKYPLYHYPPIYGQFSHVVKINVKAKKGNNGVALLFL